MANRAKCLPAAASARAAAKYWREKAVNPTNFHVAAPDGADARNG